MLIRQPRTYTKCTALSIRRRDFLASNHTFSVCLRISSRRDICSLLLGSTRFSKSACERIERHQSASRFIPVHPNSSRSFSFHSTHHLGLGCSCSHGCSHTRHFGACWSSFVRFLALRVRLRPDRAVVSPSFVPRADKRLLSVFCSFLVAPRAQHVQFATRFLPAFRDPLLVTPRSTCTSQRADTPLWEPSSTGRMHGGGRAAQQLHPRRKRKDGDDPSMRGKKDPLLSE